MTPPTPSPLATPLTFFNFYLEAIGILLLPILLILDPNKTLCCKKRHDHGRRKRRVGGPCQWRN